MLDRLTSIEVFLALVRHGTFAGAAEETDVSRAMASKHIQALENRLGVRLFHRTTRVTRLTDLGREYFESVRTLFSDLDEAEARLSEAATGVHGALTIAAPPAFASSYLVEVVAEYMRTYPQIKISLVLSDQHVDLVEQGIDIALTVRELEDTQYIARHLADVRMVVCAAPAYLQTSELLRRPEDLAQHNCLIFGDAAPSMRTQWQFRRRSEAFNVAITGNFVCNVGSALREMALNGRGVVRLPSYLVAESLANGQLEEVLKRFAPPLRPVHALFAHRNHVPARVRSFLDFAIEAFRAKRS